MKCDTGAPVGVATLCSATGATQSNSGSRAVHWCSHNSYQIQNLVHWCRHRTGLVKGRASQLPQKVFSRIFLRSSSSQVLVVRSEVEKRDSLIGSKEKRWLRMPDLRLSLPGKKFSMRTIAISSKPNQLNTDQVVVKRLDQASSLYSQVSSLNCSYKWARFQCP